MAIVDLAALLAPFRDAGVRAVTLHLDGSEPTPVAAPFVAVQPPWPPPMRDPAEEPRPPVDDAPDPDRFASAGYEPAPRRRG